MIFFKVKGNRLLKNNFSSLYFKGSIGIPNSAKLNIPKIFCNVPESPIKSAPNVSKNIFRGKKAMIIFTK